MDVHTIRDIFVKEPPIFETVDELN